MFGYIKSFLGLSKKDWQDAPNETIAKALGKTLFTVANDLHIGSKYQDNENAIIDLAFLQNNGFTVLNGDIFDPRCCSESSVQYVREAILFSIDKFGEYYRMGNHEAWEGYLLCKKPIHYSPLVIRSNGKNIGFSHGDLISDFKKWLKYRMKKHGSNKFKLLVTDFLDDLDHLKAMRPLPKKFLPNAYEYCLKYDLDILVCGHFHPEAERRYFYKDKEIVILPAHKINKVWL